MFQLENPRPRRKPSLTPMIDVVFLLLVFFMLASRFGMDMHLPLKVAGQSGGEYTGPPRLVDVLPEGIRLNGVEIAADALAAEIERLTEKPEDTIILRPRDEASLQRIVEVMQTLGDAGFNQIVLVE
ncbi:biopolymer transport protein ExbD [Poseidonocella pacifica]|uniref:Biopolymer transport protein ExbD n=1 Tax=Poseidonocella pacifica TaxID=871651 RepID=A0A1I0VGW4_9RHOB|nr:biopolymer transporter ExbD [Poseidonocella pacifica]SFA75614.1 biopolymer transport protein ExbD [Poseidonocella pacifica]